MARCERIENKLSVAKRNRLVASCIPMARMLAEKAYRRYPTLHLLGDLQDVQQTACLFLIDAARTFDPKKAAFTTHAHYALRLRLASLAQAGHGVVKVPQSALLEEAEPEYKAAALKALWVKTGDKHIAKLSRPSSPERDAERKELAHAVQQAVGSTRWGDAIQQWFGMPPYDTTKTLKEIAKVFGTNRETMRQRVVRAIERLRTDLQRFNEVA